MTPVYARVAGVVVEPLDVFWAAFSPASGQTHLLNDASAAILEVLADGACTADEVAAQLAADSGETLATVAAALAGCWPVLVDCGLVAARP